MLWLHLRGTWLRTRAQHLIEIEDALGTLCRLQPDLIRAMILWREIVLRNMLPHERCLVMVGSQISLWACTSTAWR